MVPWRGRLLFKQYIPGKKHKYGVKLFKICNPKGFTWKIQIYSGKSQDGKTQTGLGERVVMYLCEGLLGEGRTLYTDNFYTSITLAQTLLNRNTHLVGTLRKNRKNLPKSVSTKTLCSFGNYIWRRKSRGNSSTKMETKTKKRSINAIN
nr:unnamed protein product [Callosobruchus chinensis]